MHLVLKLFIIFSFLEIYVHADETTEADEDYPEYEELKYMELHMHPHPPFKKYPTDKTIMRFTYGDADKFGPERWDKVRSALFSTNECQMNKFTPMNINTSVAGLAERASMDPGAGVNTHEAKSLTLVSSPGINSAGWDFGFPEDTFNGIAIMPKAYGSLQLLDEYDSHEKAEGIKSKMFDFTFALVTFCDFKNISANRSGHQLDGKRYPFEVHLLFFGFTLQIGIDKMVFGEKYNDIVMLSVLGEISKEDNPKLQPMIKAAKKFSGADYGADYGNGPVLIQEQWSPLAFLPQDSGYYYYKGNFPIPPCFSIPRIYVLKKTIPISKKQLSVLTKMKSKREPSGVLTCTFPLLQDPVSEDQVLHNPSVIQYNRPSQHKNGAKMNTFKPTVIVFTKILVITHILVFLIR